MAHHGSTLSLRLSSLQAQVRKKTSHFEHENYEM